MFLLMPLLLLLRLLLPPAEWHRYELRGKAQGTSWSVIYYAEDSLVTRLQCDSILASLDSSLSIYKSHSRINALNAAEKQFAADRHLSAVLQKGQAIARRTDGAFDLTILPLITAWGFGAKQHTTPPHPTLIEQLRSCTGYRLLRVKGEKVRKAKPCLQVDVNGIAQGYSVDVLARFMEAKRVTNYLVEIGGELRVNGRKQPSGEPFAIGVESPEAAESYGAPLQRYLRLDSGALTTSGNYRRYYLSGNKAITHLLDPRTGFPVQNELVAVTVWAPDAITADAWDNALMVMGLTKALQAVAAEKHLAAYFIYKKNDSTVADTATPNFARLFAGSPTVAQQDK
ncbi:thiamine biosynthesis lipoprotein [Cnuella takakiae]|uniref:FAD:protein FMN transferase n=1 Tax=Cnuella takakiae TaxID=1302690 RepID=A0A1M5BZJ2_9BACT|nr:FAD:protein FMN transferase [Cnuella takakiae]OLY93566.1 hypothetical protein BUE76_18075 [Cnuella takakiae]SHF47851.1 thiamine biosynthesis lipoprotein [Cnuella takakiae]